MVSLTEHLLESQHIRLDRRVVFPSQHQNRDIGVMRLQGPLVYVHGGILEMARKGLEFVTLG